MAATQQIDVIIKRHKSGWIGHALPKDEPSVARQAMQWYWNWMVLEEKRGVLEDELWKGSTRI